MNNEEILELFRQTDALLEGHFILRSGLRSRQFFQCAQLLQHPRIAEQVCAALAGLVSHIDCESVISPAMGGIVVGHEVGRALDKRHIFAEKEDGRLVLRRGFEIKPGEKMIVAEDVVTRGGRVQETLEIVRARGGVPVAVAVLVDRSGGAAPDFGCPFFSLLSLNVETFEADRLPPDLTALPAVKPGSK